MATERLETSPTLSPAYFASAQPYGAHTRPIWMIEDRGTASGESARPAERATGTRVAADSSRPSAGCRSSTRAVRKRMPAEVELGNSEEELKSRDGKCGRLSGRKRERERCRVQYP